ncbi:MAG: hypothetical protein WCP69_03265 [Bacteroidota bacterium]
MENDVEILEEEQLHELTIEQLRVYIKKLQTEIHKLRELRKEVIPNEVVKKIGENSKKLIKNSILKKNF